MLAVLPLRIKDEKADHRQPVFALENDVSTYFQSAKIGYSGFMELTYPDAFNVIRSFNEFPKDGFITLSSKQAIKHAKNIDFFLFQIGYSTKNDRHKFSGWKKQLKNVSVVEIKAAGMNNKRFDPLYFLTIYRNR